MSCSHPTDLDLDDAPGDARRAPAATRATPPTRSAAAAPTTTRQAPPPSPSRDVRIHTVHAVADLLGVAASDVLDLIRRGALRARRVASSVVVSGDALADFMATTDAAARFPRFAEASPVAVVDDDGTLGCGVFARETDDGQVVVSRAGLLGRYEQAFPPEQVQPLTARRPTTRR